MKSVWPGRYDRRWAAVWIVMAVVFSLLLLGARLFFLKQDFRPAILPGFLVLGAAAAFAVCIFGFFGAGWIMGSTLAGEMAGLTLMVLAYRRGGGWEDLAGPLDFIVAAFAGMMLGLALEFIARLFRNPEKERRNR